MEKVVEIIKQLPEDDVRTLHEHVQQGSFAKVIEERLAELNLPQKVCPVCNAALNDSAPFLLYFGTSVRKKARFDGKDCLQFFLESMK